MKLSDCTKNQLIQILESVQQRFPTAALYISGQIYDLDRQMIYELEEQINAVTTEQLKVSRKISGLIPDYLNAPDQHMDEMTRLINERDRLERKYKKLSKKIQHI